MQLAHRCVAAPALKPSGLSGRTVGRWEQWQGWDHALVWNTFSCFTEWGYKKDKHQRRLKYLLPGCFFVRVGSHRGLSCTGELSPMMPKRLWGMPPTGASVTTVSNLMPEGPPSCDTLRKTNKNQGRLLMNCLKGKKGIASERMNV